MRWHSASSQLLLVALNKPPLGRGRGRGPSKGMAAASSAASANRLAVGNATGVINGSIQREDVDTSCKSVGEAFLFMAPSLYNNQLAKRNEEAEAQRDKEVV